MSIFPNEQQSPAEQFLSIAKSHFRQSAIERIRAQPWFQRPARAEVRDHVENDLGVMDDTAWVLDFLDPCDCPRADLLAMIARTTGERRAWLEGIYCVRERLHQLGRVPF